MFAEIPIVKENKNWDQYLLLNHPRLWAIRLPTLLGYFIVFNLIGVTISLVFPLKTYHVTQMFTWLWLFGVAEMIALGFWLRRFSWFSSEKALERTSPINGFFEILIYMFCILIFLSPTILSSAILEYRFSQMITITEIEHDRSEIRGLSLRDIYPQDLVENYTRLDYDTYLSLSGVHRGEREQVNRELENVVRKLDDVKFQDDSEWLPYLIMVVILLHISVFVFNARHNRNDLSGRTIAYGLGIMLFIGIFLGLVGSFLNDFANIPYLEIDKILGRIFNGVMVFMFGFVLFFSVRVFWQKGYKTFTAMNISLLPYVFYFEIQYFFGGYYFEHKINFLDEFFGYQGILNEALGSFWGEIVQFLMVGSPLVIAWVFIITKAMYMRMLALPEG